MGGKLQPTECTRLILRMRGFLGFTSGDARNTKTQVGLQRRSHIKQFDCGWRTTAPHPLSRLSSGRPLSPLLLRLTDLRPPCLVVCRVIHITFATTAAIKMDFYHHNNSQEGTHFPRSASTAVQIRPFHTGAIHPLHMIGGTGSPCHVLGR